VPPNDQTRRIPGANEFSPGQVKLKRVLELAKEHGGDRSALTEAIRAEYFGHGAPSQRSKRANNVIIGMSQYGLFSLSENRLTPEGEALASLNSESALMDAFAELILTKLHGVELLDAIRTIQSRHEPVSKASLAHELTARGFVLPRDTTNHLIEVAWLRVAGIIKGRYDVDDAALSRITGLTTAAVDEWVGMTQAQRALLITLRRQADIKGKEPVWARDLITQSTFEHGPVFPSGQLSAKVFAPLVAGGWISRSETTEGRGGKSGRIAATEKLLGAKLEALPSGAALGVPADLRMRLKTPLQTILAGLHDESEYERGVALELLALRLATELGLRPLRFRLRGKETGGAEVDLVAEGVHLHFSRWLFQCKNTPTVDLADLAKEIGMAVLLSAQIVVLVTTGRFRTSVRTYADEIARNGPLQVILVDKGVIDAFRTGGVRTLIDAFHRIAGETMLLKRSQVMESAGGGDPP